MKPHTLLLLAFAFLYTGQVLAQELSKEDKKKWTQIAKDYQKNPEALKSLTDERDRYRQENQQLQARITSMEAEHGQAQGQLTQLTQENQQLKTQLASTQESNRRLTQQNSQLEKTQQTAQTQAQAQPASTGGPQSYIPGVVYRVQVGAFGKNQIPAKFANAPDLFLEEGNGLQKVMLGNYRDYNEAKARVNTLKKEGVKSPWIVAFKDGKRVPVKEVQASN